jgi:drug/metabolite transporter (DMT)-like permease
MVSEGRSNILPALSASIGCISGGAAIVASRIAIAESDVYAVTLLRQFGGVLAVSVVAAVIFGRSFRVARADVPKLAGLAVLQYVGFAWFTTAALAYSPAARVALLLACMPLATLVISALLGQEQVTRLKLIGCALGLAGVAIARGADPGVEFAEIWKGDLLTAVGIVLGSLHAVLSGPILRRYTALRAGGLQLLIGLFLIGALLLALGDPAQLVSFSRQGWIAIFWLILLGGPQFFFWMWALEHTTPARVMVTIAFNPIVAALLAAWLVDEAITIRLLIGLAVVVLGVALAYWPARAAIAAAPAD